MCRQVAKDLAIAAFKGNKHRMNQGKKKIDSRDR